MFVYFASFRVRISDTAAPVNSYVDIIFKNMRSTTPIEIIFFLKALITINTQLRIGILLEINDFRKFTFM